VTATRILAPFLALLMTVAGCASPYDDVNQPSVSEPVNKTPKLLLYDGFEDHLEGWGTQTANPENLKTGEIVPARAGKQALRVRVDQRDPWVAGGPRSELLQPRALGYWEEPQEYWVGASVLFPAGYRDDPMQEIFWQLHGASGKDGNHKRAKQSKNGKRNASVPFMMQSVGDSILIRGKGIQQVSVKKTKGKWMDFVVHHRFSSEGKGITQVYVNGHLLINGQNISNLRPGERVYQKFGIYKSGWKKGYESQSTVSNREIWFDEIRIGGADSGFEAVSPGSS